MLQIGQQVIVTRSASGGRTILEVTNIESETPTQWVTKDGRRWRKKDLEMVGSDVWSRGSIAAINAENKAEFLAYRDARFLENAWYTIQKMQRPKKLTVARMKELLKEFEDNA
jgi:hypothetical protein